MKSSSSHHHSPHHRHRNQLIGSTVHWPPGSACSRTGRPARDGRLIAMYTDLLIISLILIIEIVIFNAIVVMMKDISKQEIVIIVLHNGTNLCLWSITMIAFLDGWRYFEKPIQIFESKTNNQMIESNINFLSFVQWETSKFQICWRLDSSFHLSTFPLLHCMLCCHYLSRTLSLNTTKVVWCL